MTRLIEMIRRAFAEFLTVPVLLIVGFLLLAVGTSILDYSQMTWLRPLRSVMREYFLRDSQATSDLLATIAGSMITVTSITFSLLLLAVQQAASALTHEVYDQFLRRKVNQIYFGFFVGLAVYTLVILATVDPPYNPVLGATLALLFTIIALLLLILLLYTTVNQMRPVVVIAAIHDFALLARERQLPWLDTTRRSPQSLGAVSTPVRATSHGYVVQVRFDALEAAVQKAGGNIEIVLSVSIGSFVASGDLLAEVRSASAAAGEDIAKIVPSAIRIEQQRDIDVDPAYAIEQLAIIGWTSISTAKSNPSPGLLVIESLRDVLARWATEPVRTSAEAKALPIVYSDTVVSTLMDAFETLAVVASESMQPQTIAEIVRTFAVMFERLPEEFQKRTEDVIRRSLSALGEHVLTAELDRALCELVNALRAAGRSQSAAQVRTAQEALQISVGKLGSRATRVSGTGRSS